MFELKFYLRRPEVLGRDCVLEAGADHPAGAHHWLSHSWEGDSKAGTQIQPPVTQGSTVLPTPQD